MISNKLKTKILRISRDCYEVPNSNKRHFSYIVRRSKIISFGWNNGWKSSPLSNKFGCRFDAIHSELAAIRNFPYPVSELGRYQLINVRLNAKKELANSRPCQHCLTMLMYFGMTDIVYSSCKGEFLAL